MAAIAFPASSALPPPIAITMSASRGADRIVSISGSPDTRTGIHVTPAASSASRSGSARSADAPVTSSAWRPIDAAAAGTSRSVPSPKITRCAVANSNRIPIPCARARRHPHLRDLFVPLQIVFGLLVLRRRFFIAIDLDQHDLVGIVLLLQELESRDTGFLGALSGVDLGSGYKFVEVFRFHVSMNDENVHGFMVASVVP